VVSFSNEVLIRRFLNRDFFLDLVFLGNVGDRWWLA
jgi:hypothetical protein